MRSVEGKLPIIGAAAVHLIDYAIDWLK